VKSGHQITGWYHKGSLMNLLVAFESLFEIRYRFEVGWVDIWDKVILSTPHILLESLVVLITFIFAIYFINFVPVTRIMLQ
jgi:hypothetical protein